MSDNKWIYEKATGKWMLRFRDPAVYNTPGQTAYGIADLGDGAPIPDPVRERYDPGPTGRRSATPAEIVESQADADAADALAQCTRVQMAMMAALFKNAPLSTGAFPTAQQRTQLKNDFIAAWKSLG